MSKKSMSKDSKVRTKEDILKQYIKIAKQLKRVPTEGELQAEGLTRNTIRWHYKNPKDLREQARKAHPQVFEHIIDDSLFTNDNMTRLEELVSKRDTLVISSAVTGCKLHKGFLKSINSYCDIKKGTSLYIPITDPASKAGWTIPPELGKERIVFGDLELNSNLYISGIKMSAKQIDPTTGLNRMGHKMSFIFGSPKQRLKFKANAATELPHAVMGTGAITLPSYETDRYMSDRTAKLAQIDHKIGAIVVEMCDGDIFHFRQIQASRTGAFADLGKLYMPDGTVVDYAPEFFIMGDLHPGETDPQAFKAWKEVITETKAKNVVIHDGVNGHSISHWLEGKIIDKAIMAKKGMTSLEQEGKLVAKYLREILGWIPDDGKVYMVASNHNDFVARYLNDKRFLKDYENLEFVVSKILSKAFAGEDPAKVLVELFLTKEEQARIIWFTEDTSFKYASAQLAAHGHKGPNGGKGTLANLADAYGNGFFGHAHTPGIDRDGYQVGTTTYLRLPYNAGPSSWVHCSGLLYRNGSKQLINAIDGRWRKR